jgi:class 3 adenylate cyclase
MRELPAGTVTFLFTDVEGSTSCTSSAMWYADVLAEHRRALREAFAAHGGVEVDALAALSGELRSRQGGRQPAHSRRGLRTRTV